TYHPDRSGRARSNRPLVISIAVVCADRLARIHILARSNKCDARLAINHGRSGARRLAPLVVTARERSRLRISLGVLQLLGHLKMDLHGAVSRQREDFRDAGAWLSWFSTVCDRMLGDLHLCAITTTAGEMRPRRRGDFHARRLKEFT